MGWGCRSPSTRRLYKLLIYDTGSFFIEHRDREKADGMFATLVLVLPSIYSGGELLIGHGEREVCVNLAGANPADAAFVAFYADCVHAPVAPTAPRLALAPSSDAVKLIFAYCSAIKFVSSAHGRC
jgi:hypothetical protein